MNYSKTYIAIIVMGLAAVLKWAGVEVGSADLTTTVLTLLQIAGGVWVLVERVKKGDINMLGLKK